jgi:D-alanyl-D-alanine carboxypeptidase
MRSLRGPTKDTSLRRGRNDRAPGLRPVIFALVIVFGLGYSLPGVGEEAKPAQGGPSAHGWSLLYYADMKGFPAGNYAASVGRNSKDREQKDQEQKQPGSAMTCDDVDVLVDRSHSLPPDYVPPDLVSLQDYGVLTLGSEVLRRDAAEHLGDLAERAAADGEELVVASAYRSYEDQLLSHERLIGVFGAGAGRLSATPGHSQHQLGTAVDFTNAAAGYQLWVPFAQTGAYLWLDHHAWEYGFVLAYPRGKEAQTGYEWEPWHYRYVGVENAKRIEESGLSLQEFLERAGTTPHC